MVLGISMLLALLVSILCDDDTYVSMMIFVSAMITICAGGLAFRFSRRRPGEAEVSTGAREGYAAVAFAWIAATVFCALPFILAGHFRMEDAFFEAASGLTTTGASIICPGMQLGWGAGTLPGGLESLVNSKGLLFWRSLLNWLGGVGIVFFLLLILPLMHVTQGKQLYNAEVPGMKTKGDQMTPRLTTSVKWILCVYSALTLLAIILYATFGMNSFEAICHAFSTISTGGFSTRGESIGGFNSPSLEWCVTAFMFVSACNFSLIIKLFVGRTFSSRFGFLKDEEFRFFVMMFAFATVIITLGLWQKVKGGDVITLSSGAPLKTFGDILRTAAFQVATVCSTTGFGTSDYLGWKFPLALLLIGVMMLPCGCGGSTAGGMKCSRVIVLVKQLRYEIKHCILPRTLPDVRLNGERLDSGIVAKTFSFVLLYLSIFVFVAVAVAVIESLAQHGGTCDIPTAIGASLTCISNVGPGFGNVGPSGSFAWMCWASKLLLSFTMITGRLELYTVLVILFPSFWRR